MRTDQSNCNTLINNQFLMTEHLASYPRLSSTSTFTYYVHDNTHERLRKGILQTLYNLLLIRS
jgi:hypothetical protein